MQNRIRTYIEEVGSYLPFDKEYRAEILQEMEFEVREAMQDHEGGPEAVFGKPRDTAINLVASADVKMDRAGWISRLIAYLIDSLIIVIMLTIAIGIPYLFLRDIYDFDTDPSTGWDYFIVITYSIYGMMVFLMGMGGYIIPEKLYTQTPGKKLMGMRTLDEHGIKISWKQAISRNLVKFQIEFIWLDFLLGIMMGDGLEKATDIVSKTVVVKA